MRKPKKAKAMAEVVVQPLGARRVPVEIDDQGNVVEKRAAEQSAPPKKARRVAAPVDQHARVYVPGRTYVSPKSGTKHEDR